MFRVMTFTPFFYRGVSCAPPDYEEMLLKDKLFLRESFLFKRQRRRQNLTPLTIKCFACFTASNSAFCPRIVFLFLWFWKQTTIISCFICLMKTSFSWVLFRWASTLNVSCYPWNIFLVVQLFHPVVRISLSIFSSVYFVSYFCFPFDLIFISPLYTFYIFWVDLKFISPSCVFALDELCRKYISCHSLMGSLFFCPLISVNL